MCSGNVFASLIYLSRFSNLLLFVTVSCRLSVLDVILRAIEAISIIDGHSQEISSNKDLFRLVSELVKFPDKAEVHSRLLENVVTPCSTFTDTLFMKL